MDFLALYCNGRRYIWPSPNCRDDDLTTTVRIIEFLEKESQQIFELRENGINSPLQVKIANLDVDLGTLEGDVVQIEYNNVRYYCVCNPAGMICPVDRKTEEAMQSFCNQSFIDCRCCPLKSPRKKRQTRSFPKANIDQRPLSFSNPELINQRRQAGETSRLMFSDMVVDDTLKFKSTESRNRVPPKDNPTRSLLP